MIWGSVRCAKKTRLRPFPRRGAFPCCSAGRSRRRDGELAADAGVRLAACELVGLLPAAALKGLEGEALPGIPGPQDTIEARLAGPGLT